MFVMIRALIGNKMHSDINLMIDGHNNVKNRIKFIISLYFI